MKFFRNLAGVLLTRAVGAPLGFVTSIVLARFLSPEDRGFYSLAINFASIATTLAQLGWPQAAIYRVRSGSSPAAEVAGTTLAAVAVFSGVAVTASLLAQPLLSEHVLAGLAPVAFHLALASVPLRLIGTSFGGIARSIDRFRYENWALFSVAVGTLLAAVGSLVVAPGGLVALLSALLGMYLLTNLGLLAAVLRQTGLAFRLDRKEIGASVRFGGKAYLQIIVARLHTRVDVFVLAALHVEPSQIAVYAIARGAIRMLDHVPNALGRVAYPQMAGLAKSEVNEFTCATVRQGVLLVAPMILILTPLAPVLLPAVYGPTYAASVGCFLILIPTALLGAVSMIISRHFMGINRQLPSALVQGASLLLNVALAVVLIPRLGLLGAAIAALGSSVFGTLALAAVFVATSGARSRDLVMLRSSDFAPYRSLIGWIAHKLGLGSR